MSYGISTLIKKFIKYLKFTVNNSPQDDKHFLMSYEQTVILVGLAHVPGM